MATSKRTRFEVFKRDFFTCQYCGQTPPRVVLEVDHIEPVSKGGSDQVHNLITACFDCNRGKSNTPLGAVVPMPDIEKLMEREEQLRAYNKFLATIERRKQKEIEAINEIYSARFPKWQLSDHFKNGSLKHFLSELPVSTVKDAMHLACGRGLDNNRTIHYFCGVCWRRIKGGQ